MIEDAELLRRYAEEASETAFAELVQRHLGLVYGCALRRVAGDAQLAEDVAQQVFADVARRATALARRPVLAGWLFTSARFAAAKAMRTARRRLDREQEAHLMHELSSDTTGPVDWDKARPVLDDAIGELNERDREAILLRFFEGRDFPTLGAQLNLSDNAARMRVERALEKLRTQLAHRGVTSTAAAIATVLSHQAAVALPAGLATSVTSAALAGGAIAAGVGAGASAAITFMSVTKLQIGIAGALAVAGATGFVVQAQSNADVRREMAALQQQNQEITALRSEHQRLERTAAEIAVLRQDDVALARLRDETMALRKNLLSLAQTSAAKTPDPAANESNIAARRISEKTNEAIQKLKPMQEAKNFDGMIAVIESLIPTVDPTSFDMALIMDMRAKLYGQKQQFGKMIESWEMALQLSDRFNYFDEKTTAQIRLYVAQFRYQLNPWF